MFLKFGHCKDYVRTIKGNSEFMREMPQLLAE